MENSGSNSGSRVRRRSTRRKEGGMRREIDAYPVRFV